MASDPIRILIVDDDEDVLIALERLLEGEGYATATAWSGREALALSKASRFDLLLVDEHLGDVEAATLWEGLHQHQPHAFRFLMLSRKSAGSTRSAILLFVNGNTAKSLPKFAAAWQRSRFSPHPGVNL
jgi:DNA-binding response OmpR family regulator